MSPLTSFELVVIDLDGTLVDSAGDLLASVNDMQSRLKLAASSETEIRQWIGNGVERLVHRALTGSMSDDAEADIFSEAIQLFSTAYDHFNGTCSQLYPGVIEGLDYLNSLQIPIVSVTNKAARFAKPLLSAMAIDTYFNYTIAGDDLAKKKPDPAPLLHAASLCKASPLHSLMIGDSVSDIKAAKAAEFTMVCVSYGYNHGIPVQNLTGDSRPDAIIDSFTELPDQMQLLAQARLHYTG